MVLKKRRGKRDILQKQSSKPSNFNDSQQHPSVAEFFGTGENQHDADEKSHSLIHPRHYDRPHGIAIPSTSQQYSLHGATFAEGHLGALLFPKSLEPISSTPERHSVIRERRSSYNGHGQSPIRHYDESRGRQLSSSAMMIHGSPFQQQVQLEMLNLSSSDARVHSRHANTAPSDENKRPGFKYSRLRSTDRITPYQKFSSPIGQTPPYNTNGNSDYLHSPDVNNFRLPLTIFNNIQIDQPMFARENRVIGEEMSYVNFESHANSKNKDISKLQTSPYPYVSPGKINHELLHKASNEHISNEKDKRSVISKGKSTQTSSSQGEEKVAKSNDDVNDRRGAKGYKMRFPSKKERTNLVPKEVILHDTANRICSKAGVPNCSRSEISEILALNLLTKCLKTTYRKKLSPPVNTIEDFNEHMKDLTNGRYHLTQNVWDLCTATVQYSIIQELHTGLCESFFAFAASRGYLISEFDFEDSIIEDYTDDDFTFFCTFVNTILVLTDSTDRIQLATLNETFGRINELLILINLRDDDTLKTKGVIVCFNSFDELVHYDIKIADEYLSPLVSEVCSNSNSFIGRYPLLIGKESFFISYPDEFLKVLKIITPVVEKAVFSTPIDFLTEFIYSVVGGLTEEALQQLADQTLGNDDFFIKTSTFEKMMHCDGTEKGSLFANAVKTGKDVLPWLKLMLIVRNSAEVLTEVIDYVRSSGVNADRIKLLKKLTSLPRFLRDIVLAETAQPQEGSLINVLSTLLMVNSGNEECDIKKKLHIMKLIIDSGLACTDWLLRFVILPRVHEGQRVTKTIASNLVAAIIDNREDFKIRFIEECPTARLSWREMACSTIDLFGNDCPDVGTQISPKYIYIDVVLRSLNHRALTWAGEACIKPVADHIQNKNLPWHLQYFITNHLMPDTLGKWVNIETPWSGKPVEELTQDDFLGLHNLLVVFPEDVKCTSVEAVKRIVKESLLPQSNFVVESLFDWLKKCPRNEDSDRVKAIRAFVRDLEKMSCLTTPSPSEKEEFKERTDTVADQCEENIQKDISPAEIIENETVVVSNEEEAVTSDVVEDITFAEIIGKEIFVVSKEKGTVIGDIVENGILSNTTQISELDADVEVKDGREERIDYAKYQLGVVGEKVLTLDSVTEDTAVLDNGKDIPILLPEPLEIKEPDIPAESSEIVDVADSNASKKKDITSARIIENDIVVASKEEGTVGDIVENSILSNTTQISQLDADVEVKDDREESIDDAKYQLGVVGEKVLTLDSVTEDTAVLENGKDIPILLHEPSELKEPDIPVESSEIVDVADSNASKKKDEPLPKTAVGGKKKFKKNKKNKKKS